MRWKLCPPGKRGRFYYLRGTHGGKRFEVSTRTADKGGAERIAAIYIARRLRGADPDEVSFSVAADAYMAFRNPGKLDEKWLGKLGAWFAGRPVAGIRHNDLVDAATSLLPRGAAGTRNRHVISPAAAVLHYAAEQGWCEYRRFRRFKEPRRSSRKPATEGAMRKLLEATQGHQRMFLAMLYETGLRISDLLRLTDNDLDLPRRAILVRIGKTDDRARIGISRQIVAMLSSLPRYGDRVFSWGDRHNVYRWLKPLRKKLRVKYTPHQSRHALATDLLNRGVPDKAAAEYGAWADPRSLHRYQHAAPKPMKDRGALELLGDKRGKKRRSR